jgi:hypothetical protein
MFWAQVNPESAVLSSHAVSQALSVPYHSVSQDGLDHPDIGEVGAPL